MTPKRLGLGDGTFAKAGDTTASKTDSPAARTAAGRQVAGTPVCTTVSSRFQTVIPSEIREKFDIREGSRLAWVDKGDSIEVVPVPVKPWKAFRGAGRKSSVSASLLSRGTGSEPMSGDELFARAPLEGHGDPAEMPLESHSRHAKSLKSEREGLL